MSAQKTRIFGMQLGLDPKIIVLILLVIAAAVYYFNSRDEDRPASAVGPVASTAAPESQRAATAPLAASRAAAVRRSSNSRGSSRIGLKLVPIDGSRGDVDPTLRLHLLDRVRSVAPAAGLRNLFEGDNPAVANLPPVPKGPTLPPKPKPEIAASTAPPPPPPPPPFSIPLKYYGFAKPNGKSLDGNRGLFLDGDSILLGGEGDVLERRYLIVALTPNSARLEDTQKKQGQDLPVTPAAQ